MEEEITDLFVVETIENKTSEVIAKQEDDCCGWTAIGPGLSPGVPAWISLFPYTLSRGFLQLQLMTVQQVEVSANSK